MKTYSPIVQTVLDIVRQERVTLAEACKKVEGAIYMNIYSALTVEDREEVVALGREITKEKRKNPITQEIYDKVKATMIEHKISLQKACGLVGVNYSRFYYYTTAKQRSELPNYTYISRAKPVDLNAVNPATEPKAAVKSITFKRPEAPYVIDEIGLTAPVDDGSIVPLLSLPKVIFRISKNFIGAPIATKGRLFIRIEADEYFVIGYEFISGLSDQWLIQQQNFKVDQHLYDYNTSLALAIKKLLIKVTEAIENGVSDKIHGSIKYSLQPPPPHDPKIVVVKSKLNLPDGEYHCNVFRDLGHVLHNSSPIQFATAENLPRMENLPMIVKDKTGKIYLPE